MSRLIILLFAFTLNLSHFGFAQDYTFQKVKKDFVEEYTALNLPPIRIAYAETINDIPDPEVLLKQESFFKKTKEKLETISAEELPLNDQLDFLLMNYEIELNLNRINLSKSWEGKLPEGEHSIYEIQNGKEWYCYLLKRWVDQEVNPDSLFVFGKQEVKFVKEKMDQIKSNLQFTNEEFETHLQGSFLFITDVNTVQKQFEEAQERIKSKLVGLFPYTDQIEDAKISQGTNSNLAQVPAFYDSGTFYYNYFDKPYIKRQIEWIYAHEAFPGHHYQGAVNELIKRSEIQNLFWYPGFVEGWGAYVEYLDFYSSPMDEYGKWEWDLIRSVRVVLDVGINYYGWSDEQAMVYWKKHIYNQDDIAIREINRMKRWPAQVITYKYGANAMLKMLEKAKKSEDFNYALFHQKLLKHGDIPISILQKINKELKP